MHTIYIHILLYMWIYKTFCSTFASSTSLPLRSFRRVTTRVTGAAVACPPTADRATTVETRSAAHFIANEEMRNVCNSNKARARNGRERRRD